MLSAAQQKKSVGLTGEDKIFYTVINISLFLILLVVIIPMMNVIASSFSSGSAVSSGRVLIWPVEFSLDGYKAVFRNEWILSGYLNTIFYTAAGTAFNVFITVLAAYPLSRQDLKGRNFFMLLFTITMLFNGGMIPTYIVVSDLGLINTRWAMILPGALSVYNMIITRTFFMTSIPKELLEASRMDGCSDFTFFIKIVLPLSKAILAVITLFYAVSQWNAFFNAFLYLNDRALFPLQIILRDILLANSLDPSMMVDPHVNAEQQNLADLIKYSLIIVASLPVWCMYPFVQKYFVKGVMIGSVKG